MTGVDCCLTRGEVDVAVVDLLLAMAPTSSTSFSLFSACFSSAVKADDDLTVDELGGFEEEEGGVAPSVVLAVAGVGLRLKKPRMDNCFLLLVLCMAAVLSLSGVLVLLDDGDVRVAIGWVSAQE